MPEVFERHHFGSLGGDECLAAGGEDYVARIHVVGLRWVEQGRGEGEAGTVEWD